MTIFQKRPQYLYWIGVDGSREVNEFQHVQPPLTALDLGDEGLRLIETYSDILLGKAGLTPGCEQKRAQNRVVR